MSKDKEIHVCFIDLAFDRVRRGDIWKALNKRGTDGETIVLIRVLYENKNCVKLNNEESREFETGIGVKQEYILSPSLFSIVMDEAMPRRG